MNKEKIIICETKGEVAEKTKEVIEKGDYILVKGANSMKLSDIVKELI